MKRLAQLVFWISMAVHFALYPLSTAVIVIGFWKLGLWRGLLGSALISLATVGLIRIVAAASSSLITRLDPEFFS